MQPSDKKQDRILAIDDQLVNLKLLKVILRDAGYEDVHLFQNPIEAIQKFEEVAPDIVLLDYHMPALSGLDVLSVLKPQLRDEMLPFLILTSDEAVSIREEAFRLGALDYVIKPFDKIELIQRVSNFLQMRKLHENVRKMNSELEAKVEFRTLQLKEAWMEIHDRLARATSLRDNTTGNHVDRVGNLCFEIALAMGCSQVDAEQLGLAAKLHDVGKIGISDTILNKPDKLTYDEMEIMRTHTSIGAEILQGAKSALIKLAFDIALNHHERWDGAGYPNGIKGYEIPLAARICSVADVFDSLTHVRPYKKAWEVEAALQEIEAHRGTQFDPDVVDAFCKVILREDDPAALKAA